jgi:ElaB/YqjD/DUF883 family membrane-anchored ribosome-binding protein
MAKAAATDIDDVADDVEDVVADAQDAIVNLIQEQPITSVLIALFAGIVIGKIIL